MKKTIFTVITLLAAAAFLTGQSTMSSMADSGLRDFESLETAGMKASEGPVVLFFYAEWCPTCKAALKEFKKYPERFPDITLYIVNYDRSSELKRKYGVTYQHTFVQIDSSGNMIAEWNGGAIQELLANTRTGGMN